MGSSLNIAKRIIQEIKSDKRTVALLFVAPLIIITLIYFLFNADYQTIDLGVYNPENAEISQVENATIITYKSIDEIDQAIADSKIDAGLIIQQAERQIDTSNIDVPQMFVEQIAQIKIPYNTYQIKYSGENPIYDQYIQGQIAQSITKDNSLIETVNTKYDYDIITMIIIMVMEFVIFFFSFLVVGISFLRERNANTLQRMLTYKIKRSQIVFGYLLGFGVIASIQSILIELYLVYILSIDIQGNLFISIFANILVAFSAIGLGMLISAFVKSEFQVMQFIPIVIIPQIVFSNILPYSGVYQTISNVMPITYAYNMQKQILLQGTYDISSNIIYLIIFILITSILTSLTLKKIRKI